MHGNFRSGYLVLIAVDQIFTKNTSPFRTKNAFSVHHAEILIIFAIVAVCRFLKKLFCSL